VECTPDEGCRVEKESAETEARLEKKRAKFPRMKLERRVPLNGLADYINIQFADIDGDGKLEILAGQSSEKIASQYSLTKLTCLTAIDLTGKVIWQAGVPQDATEPDYRPSEQLQRCADHDKLAWEAPLPYRVHDLFGDGHPAVVCVFGYDVQVRDGKTGKVLMSASTPPSRPMSDEFKALIAAQGRWGDETLNMDVNWIDFCDSQGNGGKKEIVVGNNFDLAVLDPFAEPALHAIWRHRGNISYHAWIGDIDCDGKDEIIAGSSVLDDNGTLIAVFRPGALAPQISVCNLLDEKAAEKHVYFSADYEGLYVADLNALRAGSYANEALHVNRVRPGSRVLRHISGKFRDDIPGQQLATIGYSTVALFDADTHQIWQREYDDTSAGVPAVNWTGKSERLMLLSMGYTSGLIDGFGEIVVEAPNDGPNEFCIVIKGYCPDGRDAIAAWDNDELAIYVPDK
jgi:hypothetical protein